MNTNTVVSCPVAADLSGKEHQLVKLTATGIDIAAIGDTVIGTLMRGNVKKETGSAVGLACDVFLCKANGLRYAVIGNATAITRGDQLEISATAGRLVKKAAGTAVALAWESFPANSTGGVLRVLWL